jgi:hypothetical protein
MANVTNTASNVTRAIRAIVMGGSRGIGAAIVQRLLDGGATVVTMARDATDETPKAATFIRGDISTLAGVHAFAAAALDELGGVDIVVNNGFTPDEAATTDDHLNSLNGRGFIPFNFVVTDIRLASANFAGATVGVPRGLALVRPLCLSARAGIGRSPTTPRWCFGTELKQYTPTGIAASRTWLRT